MVVRFVALLLTLILGIGVTVASAAPGDPRAPAASMVDNTADSLDLDPAITVRPVALARPITPLLAPISVAPQSPTGRLHAVLVFRPPR
ncbi:MAG TPA: hypothetical protein VGC42_10780 [Kofleriaceae bacterium]